MPFATPPLSKYRHAAADEPSGATFGHPLEVAVENSSLKRAVDVARGKVAASRPRRSRTGFATLVIVAGAVSTARELVGVRVLLFSYHR